jgi:MFS family permease
MASDPTQPTRPNESQADAAKGDFSHAWRALRHRNFRLFFGGQTISLVGTWMTRIATAWLVYRLTKSALLLGTVSFAGQIPTFLLAPFAGVLIDRADRRQVLVWTQTLSMIQSLLLAWLTLSHRINIAEILVLSSFQGVINAVDMPARQSFMVQMVAPQRAGSPGAPNQDRSDLSNAIAINSSMVNVARLVGPSLAGMVIAVSSEGWCFLVDGISYIAVIVSLLMMHLNVAALRCATTSMFEQMREGWDYVSAFTPIRTILTLFALISLMGMPYMVLMPVFAGNVLHGGPHTLGFLMGAAGAGALISAFSLVLRRSVRGLTKMIPIAAMVFGGGLVLFGFSRWLWLSLILMLFTGWGMLQGLTASNTIIQTLVPEDKRGRVMSYYTAAFMGMAPFGSLLAGSLAHWIGAPRTVMFTGSCCIAGGIWFWTRLPAIRREMRPVYEQLGIIPPLAQPIEEPAAD